MLPVGNHACDRLPTPMFASRSIRHSRAPIGSMDLHETRQVFCTRYVANSVQDRIWNCRFVCNDVLGGMRRTHPRSPNLLGSLFEVELLFLSRNIALVDCSSRLSFDCPTPSVVLRWLWCIYHTHQTPVYHWDINHENVPVLHQLAALILPRSRFRTGTAQIWHQRSETSHP